MKKHKEIHDRISKLSGMSAKERKEEIRKINDELKRWAQEQKKV